MSNVSNKSVNIYIDQTSAQLAFDNLQKKADGFSNKIENARKKQAELNEQIKKTGEEAKNFEKLEKEYKKITLEIEQLTKSYNKNKQEIADTTSKIESYGDKIEVARQKQARLTAEIAKAEESGKSIVRLKTQYKNLDDEISVLTNKFNSNLSVLNSQKIANEQLSRSLQENKVKLKEVGVELKRTQDAGKTNNALQNQYNKLEKDIVATTTKLNENANAQAKIKQQIDSGLRPSFAQLSTQVSKLRNELKNMSEDAPGYAEKFKAFRNASNEMNRLQTSMNGAEKAQRSWMSEAKTVAFGVVIGNTVQSAIASVGSYLSGIVSGNAKLSDSLSDIEKSTGLSSSAVKELNTQLSSINTRTKTSDLREIAVGLGQIGEAANKSNVQAIDRIVVALGDEFGGGAKEITTTLSVLRNNLQDIKTGDYATDVTHIGNALNTLGAEGLATAPVVTDIANRIAGIGQTFGLTSGQILGTAATFQELGIETERGSTAITKLFQKIGAEPEKFAKVAGIGIKEFKELVNRDMLGAFDAVAAGAKKAGANNIVFSQILKELDADGSGAGEVLSKLGANHELLAKKVDTATNALKSQSSITEEFDKKNNNLAANVEKLGKIIDRWFTNSALTGFFSALVTGLTETLTPAKTLTEQFNDQLKTVFDLETKTRPLIDRYDELSKKSNELGGTTKLSKKEQSEMKTIIEQVASTIPSAITEVDKYGKAIGISTTRVREYINTEKDRLKVVNAGAIEEITKSAAQVNKQFDILDKRIKERNEKGFFNVQVKGEDGTIFSRRSTQKEIQELDANYQSIISKRNGLNAELKRLNGDALQEQLDASKKAAEEQAKIDEENKKKKGAAATNPFGDNEADKKAMEERLRLREKYAQLIEGLNTKIVKSEGDELEIAYNKINVELAANIKLVEELLNKGAISAKEAAGAIKLAQNAALAASDEAYKKFVENRRKERGVAAIELTVKPVVKELDLNKLIKDAQVVGEGMTASLNRAASTRLNTQLQFGKPSERLAAQLQILEAEKQQRLNVANITVSEIAAIEEEFRLKQDELVTTSYTNQINTVLSFAQQGLAILDQFMQAKSAREKAALDRELKNNDERKKGIDKLEKAKVLTAIEAERQRRAIDIESDKKKEDLERKQFERNKKIQIAQALINGFMGVTSVLAARPGAADIISLGAFRAISIAFTLASTAAQIASIGSAKYAKGGIANGPSHAEGGISMIDNKGRKVGEMEGGEPYMILSKDTYRNNRSLIDGLLYSSMYQGGRTVVPAYKQREYRPIDYAGITRNITEYRYAVGGVFNGTASSSQDNNKPAPQALDPEFTLLLQKLLFRLDNPIAPNVSVGVDIPLTKIRDAEKLESFILNEAK